MLQVKQRKGMRYARLFLAVKPCPSTVLPPGNFSGNANARAHDEKRARRGAHCKGKAPIRRLSFPGTANRRCGPTRARVPNGRSTPGRARAADGGSLLPHSTSVAELNPKNSLRMRGCWAVSRREIPRLRVPALRTKSKARDTPLGMTTRATTGAAMDSAGLPKRQSPTVEDKQGVETKVRQ